MRNFPLPHEKRGNVHDLHHRPKILLLLGGDPFIQVPRMALALLGTCCPDGWLLFSVRQRRTPEGEAPQATQCPQATHQICSR